MCPYRLSRRGLADSASEGKGDSTTFPWRKVNHFTWRQLMDLAVIPAQWSARSECLHDYFGLSKWNPPQKRVAGAIYKEEKWRKKSSRQLPFCVIATRDVKKSWKKKAKMKYTSYDTSSRNKQFWHLYCPNDSGICLLRLIRLKMSIFNPAVSWLTIKLIETLV